MSIKKEPDSLETLQEQIKITRKRMHQLWNEKGCVDAEVLKVSTELDCLLNKYQCIVTPQYHSPSDWYVKFPLSSNPTLKR